MPEAGAIRAGKAYVEVGTDNNPLYRGLAAGAARMKSWGASLNALGAAAGERLTAFGSSVFSGLKRAALFVGIGGAAVVGALFGVGKMLADAETALPPSQAKAAKELRESFAQLDGSAKRTAYAIAEAFQPAISALVDIIRLVFIEIRKWIDANPELIASVTDFIGSIRDALSAGDLKLAAEILWTGLKVVWQMGINAIIEPWTRWKTAFQQVAVEAFFGVLHIANNVWAGIRSGISEIAGWFHKKWMSVLNWFQKRFIDLQRLFGLISKEEARKSKEALDKGLEDKHAARDEQTRQRRADLEKERRGREEALGEMTNEATSAVEDANAREVQAAKDKLEDLKKQLAGLQKDAKDKAKDPQNKLPDEKVLERRLSVIGTTSSAAAARLGSAAADPAKKTAENTAKALSKQDRQIRLLEEIAERRGFFQ